MTVFYFETLPLGMKKIVFSPFGMRVPTPWASLPRLLANAFIHTSDSDYFHSCLYSCDIPVMGYMAVLASNLMYASCAVRIRVGHSGIVGIAVVPLAL